MQDSAGPVIVSTRAVTQVSLIDTGDTICVEFESADGQAAFVLLPSKRGLDLVTGLRSALRRRKSKL